MHVGDEIDFAASGHPLCKDEDGHGRQQAVQRKPAELRPAHQGHHSLACRQTGDERSEETGHQRSRPEAAAETLPAPGHLQQAEKLLSHDGNQHHEERELGHAVPPDPAEQSGGDGGAGAREPGSHGAGLAESDHESLPPGDAVAVMVPDTHLVGEAVGQRKEHRRDAQADAHDEKAVAEQAFDEVLEEEAHHGHGNHGHADLQEVVGLVVIPELENTLENLPYHRPEHHYGAEHRREMH